MERFNKAVEEIRMQSDLAKFKNLQGKQPVIFGAGDCGHHVYDILHGANIEVAYFCDNRTERGYEDEKTGLRVVNPRCLADSITRLIVLVCVVERKVSDSIYGQLLELGIDKTRILLMGEYFYRQPITYFEDNIEKYRKAYRLLEDDLSRQVS